MVSARAGTMFGLSPPSVNTPWMRSAGQDVLAQRGDVDVAEHGGVERVAALLGRGGRVGCGAGVGDQALLDRRACSSPRSSAPAGWTIIAASTSVEGPARIMNTLPPPPSSAGVPRIDTRPPHSSASAAAARPAPSPAAAMMLCPQAWPMPGSASYSRQTAMSGPCLAGAPDERGVEPEGVTFGVDALVVERVAQQVVGEALLEVQLGVGVDRGATRRAGGRRAGRSRRPSRCLTSSRSTAAA